MFQIICFSIVIPTITCAFATAFFICFVSGGTQRRHNGTTTAQQNSDPAAITPQPTTIIAGLDESTIESYTKVILGESRRLPGPNNDTCPICLSEYHAKEMVRCIPECKHCFHADCIDEWLRLNGTCPVCRNSPSLSHCHFFASISKGMVLSRTSLAARYAMYPHISTHEIAAQILTSNSAAELNSSKFSGFTTCETSVLITTVLHEQLVRIPN